MKLNTVDLQPGLGFGRRAKSLRSAGLRLIRFRSLAKIHFPSEGRFDRFRIGPISGRGRLGGRGSSSVIESPFYPRCPALIA